MTKPKLQPPGVVAAFASIEGLSASIRWKKFLRWQFAEVCEADNTGLSNVFQICSSLRVLAMTQGRPWIRFALPA